MFRNLQIFRKGRRPRVNPYEKGNGRLPCHFSVGIHFIVIQSKMPFGKLQELEYERQDDREFVQTQWPSLPQCHIV